VEPGWEAAVENVLAGFLDSVLVDDTAALAASLGGLAEGGSLTLLDRGSGDTVPVQGSLAEKVTAPAAIIGQLNSVRTVDSLDEAMTLAEGLDEGASVVTAQGQWFGPGWVRVAGSETGAEGMLAREQEIKDIRQQIERTRRQWSDLDAANRKAREALPGLERAAGELQQRVNDLHRESAELDSRLGTSRARIEDLSGRRKQIAGDVAALKRQQDEDRAQIKASRAELETQLDTMAEVEQERTALDAQREALLERRNKARAAAREAGDTRHELALKTESRRASVESLRNSLERMDSQLAQLQQRYLELSERVAREQDPEAQHREEMDRLLQSRVEVEQRLGAARARMQDLEEDYRQLDAVRQGCIQHLDEIRSSLERARLQQQEVELNARNLERQVGQLGQDVTALAGELPDDVDVEAWQEDLERLGVRITRLEPVNLAAISEYEQELKRKEYLDAQYEDLIAALETLENAIKKIDRKTRTRFKDTFESVNKGLQELFPKLFGGGHAYLELTGDDLLTTGVSIMARPPGKRVASIHLLSGGEKALTAVAFVFAIFRLNPAPFCLLDEVDAPLDEANVMRYMGIVKEMSASVQFIMVTHNKITMEEVHHLSGVTMREPGVSRLVQVDIEEAARFAAD
jgi:chromosome segregation protein